MSLLLSHQDLIIPTDEMSRMAGESAIALRQGADLGNGKVGVRMTTPEGEKTLLVPVAIVDLMATVLAQLGQCRPVILVPENAELTIPEAADLLNVSRPFVAGLLDREEIPSRGQGVHRRIVYRDLAAFKARSDADGDRAMAELAELSQEMELG
jgi:excisionase family DNA binding protein